MTHENLWAPWRMAYLRDLERRRSALGSADDAATNFFAAYWRTPEEDVRNHVVFRDAHGMILLNRYPYANGHLLVALGDARPTLLDYEPPQRAAFWGLIETGLELMRRAANPQGVNVGINEGAAAGAGVPEHLHAHLVPRWIADTNFITVVGAIRVAPDALETVARAYREAVATLPRARRAR
jgi:ATP adenylyltransferase